MRLGRIDRLPAWLWLALPAAALLPVWRWSAARLLDGSDDPLGFAALAVLVLLAVRDRERLLTSPRRVGVWCALALAAAAVLGAGTFPALVRGVLGVMAMCAALIASRTRAQPLLAIAGLGLLALPLLSSLQFYAGFPLRVITAEASRLLLTAGGMEVARSGSALMIAGRLVLVDAPCSGIRMAWVAYFIAFLSSAWLRLPDRRLVGLLPFVGATVLAGNIVRNTLLVAMASSTVAWPPASHEAIGMAAFAGVCVLVLRRLVNAARVPATEPPTAPDLGPVATGSFPGRARMLVLAAYAGLAAWPWLQHAAPYARPAAYEWPVHFEGRPLRPLALSAVERRFADRFPGAIGRFTDEERIIVLRHVTAPTRMLHPAADCFRGLGYRVYAEALENRTLGRQGTMPALWRCFVAKQGSTVLRVCDRIVDASGQSFTDTSAWYWSAVSGRSAGPWQAVTTATPM
jgi:exosortase/archaeosortase family protein